MKKRIVVLTKSCPKYREAFFDNMKRMYADSGLTIMGEIKNGECLTFATRDLKSYSFLKGKMEIHVLPWRELIECDVLIVNANPRLVMYIAISLVRRLLNKEVIIWGHYKTANSKEITRQARLLIWGIFKKFLVYTEKEVFEMRQRRLFKNKEIVSINNGLDQSSLDEYKVKYTSEQILDWQIKQNIRDKRVLLSCSRILQKNRFDIVPEAIFRVIKYYPDILWVVIGCGKERENIEQDVSKFGIQQHVRWVGEEFDESILALWFLSSEYMLHPAGLGLSVLHSFGYSLPIITTSDFAKQMPEAALVKNGENGVTFTSVSSESLAQGIIEALAKTRKEKNKYRENADALVGEYNTTVMATRVQQLL